MYKELFERWRKGERDIDLALEVGVSVSTFYKNISKFTNLSNRLTDDDWNEYYKRYQNKELKAIDIVKETNLSLNTVYANLNKIKHKQESYPKLIKEEVLKAFENGATAKSLAIKYGCTPSHIRFVIRSHS